MPADLPVAVGVKVLESLHKYFFIGDKFLVTGGNHEFLKLDLPILVVIDEPKCCVYLEVGLVRFECFYSFRELLEG